MPESISHFHIDAFGSNIDSNHYKKRPLEEHTRKLTSQSQIRRPIDQVGTTETLFIPIPKSGSSNGVQQDIPIGRSNSARGSRDSVFSLNKQ